MKEQIQKKKLLTTHQKCVLTAKILQINIRSNLNTGTVKVVY